MTDLHASDAIQELIARGLIAAQPTPRPLARGNVDRKDATRSSWLVSLPSGERAKLTLGRDLATLASRHAALARACPDIATAQLHFVQLDAGDALVESFFDGPTLESAAGDGLLPAAVIRQAVTGLCASLAATEQPSSESARAAEWKTWTRQLVALPVWQPAEAGNLEQILLPALYPLLATDAAVTRWTNGDFLPANILLNAGGEARLIDTEFAARTHFFAEDAVRFHVLSPSVQEQPDLFAGLLPGRDLPWHLYFWLRQFQLENVHNTPSYLSRVQPARLGLIRRLAEQVLGVSLPGWSVSALFVEQRPGEARWLPDTNRAALISGWCHVPGASRLRAIVALGRTGRLAMTPPLDQPDVRPSFRNEPPVLYSEFSLTVHARPEAFPITLCAVIDQGTLVPFHALADNDLLRGAFFWDEYPAWAARNDPDPPSSSPVAKRLDEPAIGLATAGSSPLLSVLLPVYQTPETYLDACIEAVRAQHHPQWELCVVDDGSGSPGFTDKLQRLAATDPRIRVQTRASNGGISRATNDALAMARGEFVVLLDHDDLLRPHALAEIAGRLTEEPALDAVYSDEDKITADGQRLIPFLKPDYSPEFLLGVMYIGHVMGVRTSVARAAGGFDPTFDGVQDYEFFLRVTERTSRIGHIPHILYHWRQSPASSALHGNIKGNMDQKQTQAVQAHLQRRGDRRTARPIGGHRVRLDYPVTPVVETVHAPGPGSALAALRRAACASTAEVLVLLSVEPKNIPEAALTALAAVAALPDSGCVAPLLLSSEGRVYESGLAGSCPIMRGFDPESDGYHGSLRCNREVDAVSPACIAVRRALVTVGDVDWAGFCARLRARGLYHRVCASARVQLHASFRDSTTPGTPAAGTREFYHPLFNAQKGDYTLAPSAPDRTTRAAGLQFYVDQPVRWDDLPRCLISRGWCFSGSGKSIAGIRLRMADLVLAGVIGLSRPDVRTARPDAPDEFTGFEIRGTLPAGRHQVCLEAGLADGTWQLLMTRSVSVRRQFLPRWLGGGDWTELMFCQMPAHMAYPARPVRPEKFPAAKPGAPRPKFCIVTPSYNQARFLPETMRSVLDQPNVTCDYVVQDGGSADGSKELIAHFAETGGGRQEAEKQRTEAGVSCRSLSSDMSAIGPATAEASAKDDPASGLRPPANALRTFAWASERDAGQADAIVRAFAKTTGGADDIMAWINSDDFYLPGTLGYVAAYFAAHPDVDVLYGHRIVVNEESQEIGRWFLPRHDPEVLRLNDFVPQETLFWRRRIWDKAGGIDPTFKFAMDWDLLLRFQAAGAKIVRVPYFLACFRVHAAQKTAARMHDVGQKEITLLRERTHGWAFPPQELERNPRLLAYLRRSAFIEFLWRLGIRSP